MKILVLGGTVFLGRHIVDIALERGHEITLFNRGQRNPDLFPNLEKLQGSRDGGLEVLKGRSWDAVIDTSGYVPRIVRASAELLRDAVPHYTFISSISVFADFQTPGMDENAPVGKIPDETAEEITGESYGPLKALCEQATEAAMPGRVLNVRPGLIVGPYDPTDRFTYWPHRIAAGGEVLAPGNPQFPVQFIDVRDLAAWIVRMVERQATGVYNATGPDYTLSMQKFLEECQATIQSDARLTWVPADFLLEQNVTPWVELPLWVPDTAENAGFSTVDCSKAFRDGLTFRPVSETVRDTLAWDATRPSGYEFRAGLKPDKEQAVLQAWHNQSGQ